MSFSSSHARTFQHVPKSHLSALFSFKRHIFELEKGFGVSMISSKEQGGCERTLPFVEFWFLTQRERPSRKTNSDKESLRPPLGRHIKFIFKNLPSLLTTHLHLFLLSSSLLPFKAFQDEVDFRISSLFCSSRKSRIESDRYSIHFYSLLTPLNLPSHFRRLHLQLPTKMEESVQLHQVQLSLPLLLKLL